MEEKSPCLEGGKGGQRRGGLRLGVRRHGRNRASCTVIPRTNPAVARMQGVGTAMYENSNRFLPNVLARSTAVHSPVRRRGHVARDPIDLQPHGHGQRRGAPRRRNHRRTRGPHRDPTVRLQRDPPDLPGVTPASRASARATSVQGQTTPNVERRWATKQARPVPTSSNTTAGIRRWTPTATRSTAHRMASREPRARGWSG